MRTQAEQIAELRADREFWRSLAAEVGPRHYTEPGPMGEWSFADMAGHLSGWRERTITTACSRSPAASRSRRRRGRPSKASPPRARADAAGRTGRGGQSGS